jgi:hypothetical protein
MSRFITRSSIAVDTTGPTAPTITAAAASTSTITVTRTANATDVSGVANYETQRSLAGAGSWTTVDTSNTTPLTVSGLSEATSYDFRQRGIDTLGNLGTFSATATASTSSTLAFSGLRSSIDMTIDDNTGGTDTIVWTSDGTGSFARITYVAAGTIRLLWPYADRNQTGGYVKLESRFSASGKTAKHLKVFGQGYPTNYSNCTWPANAGTIPEILYDDSTGGGDLASETSFTGSLTGGGAYSRTPHPTFHVTSSIANDTSWHTWEYWFRFNDNGINNGEFAAWKDGTLVFWVSDMWNCGTGLSKRDFLTFGDFSAQSGWTLDFRNVDIGYSRPTGRGI